MRRRQYEGLNSGQRASILLYTLLNVIVDSCFPIIDARADQMSVIEERIFGRFDRETQRHLFAIRREFLIVRRVIGPERDILNELIRRESPIFGEDSLVYFQVIYACLLRVADKLDLYHDMLPARSTQCSPLCQIS